jgi:dTDP-glucose 4,6-dehydratase
MNPLATDLEHVLARTEGLWEELRGGRLFLTGATGFFGCWLLESLLWANDRLGLNVQVVALSRNPGIFARKAPHLAAHAAVRWQAGDVADFPWPDGSFTHVIHAASELNNPCAADPVGLLERAFAGQRQVLQLAAQRGVAKFLYTSSGAVHGPAVPGRHAIREDDPVSALPLEPRGAYAEAKRLAELLGALYARQHGFEFKLARGYAFLGPYLPLEGHFAAGNFLRDALAGGPVTVQGSGTAVRSYLHGADLAVWLWTILFRGVAGRPYNLGSDVPVSVVDLARAVARACSPELVVRVLGQARPGDVVDYYVPDLSRAHAELGLEVSIPLATAIQRTLAWYRESPPRNQCFTEHQ